MLFTIFVVIIIWRLLFARPYRYGYYRPHFFDFFGPRTYMNHRPMGHRGPHDDFGAHNMGHHMGGPSNHRFH